MSGETRLDSYIGARYRRPTGDLPVSHVPRKTPSLPRTQTPPFPQGFVCPYNVPYYLSIKLPTVKPPYNGMGYITIFSILRSTPLISPFSV